jgi:hypothetical protein
MRIETGLTAFVAALAPLCLGAEPQYPVVWNEQRVDIAVPVGSEKHLGVSVTTKQDLRDIDLDVVPALAPFVSLTPTRLGALQRDQPMPVWLAVSAPEGSQPGIYEGTVHLRRGPRTLARPLRIILTVLPTKKLELPDRAGAITVVANTGTLDVTLIDAPTPPPGVAFPFGVFNVEIREIPPGSSTQITLAVPTSPLGDRLYKYVRGSWMDISDLAVFATDRVTYTLTDGGDLDDDGAVNGSISDPIGLGVAIDRYSDACNPVAEYSHYATTLASTYGVPADILRAVMLQESTLQQYRCYADGTKRGLVSGDGGIGLMQVTPATVCPSDICSLGSLRPDSRVSIVSLVLTPELKQKLADDWKFNMEVGARILLAKKGLSDASGSWKDPAILENWYYPLARYNGYVQYSPTNLDYCSPPGPFNDPSAPCYTRRSLDSLFSRSVFPYQELIAGHLAGYSKPLVDARVAALLPDTKLTLPGPMSVCSGAGRFSYLLNDFRGGDAITHSATLPPSSCGSDYAIGDMVCEPSPGVTGTAEITRFVGGGTTDSIACVHGVVSSDVTFEFVGHEETWVVPAGVTSITVDARGAQGGGDVAPGGKGARVETTLSVVAGEPLYVYVGGHGEGAGYKGSGRGGGAGGYNGGAPGASAANPYTWLSGAGGGGASDIRRGGTDLTNRVVVAGGGGGGTSHGGGAGGFNGGPGQAAWADGGGGGATQTSAGSAGAGGGGPVPGHPGGAGAPGVGGNGGSGYGGGAGGGGGWYGGGGGGGEGWNGGDGAGGGGGSSYSAGSSTTHTQSYQQGNGQITIRLNR